MRALPVLFALLWSSATVALADDCERNTNCRAYRSGHSYKLYPITAARFCVTLHQRVPDRVVLRLWHVDVTDELVLNADWLRAHVRDIAHVTYAPTARPFAEFGTYCFKRSRVESPNMLVELCNGSASAYLPPAELAEMIADGLTSTPRGLNLRGKEP